MRHDPDAAFAALADPVRRAILARLAEGEATVAELAAPFPISQPAVSRHLRVLQQAGLVETRIAGSTRPRRLNRAALAATAAWFGPLLATLEARFGALDDFLAETAEKPEGDAG